MSSSLICYDKCHLLQMENISSLFIGLEGQFADPFMISNKILGQIKMTTKTMIDIYCHAVYLTWY